MPAARFVRLVERLHFYPGAVQAEVLRQAHARGQAVDLAPAGDGAEVVAGDRQSLASNRAFRDLIEWG